MLRILIQTIPHNQHRYPTVGDYTDDDLGGQTILVSDCSNWKYELLVAFHELIEQNLLKARNISEESVRNFDVLFEAGNPNTGEEPGEQPDAPYYNEHMFAEKLERIYAKELGVDWDEYEEYLDNLWATTRKPTSTDNNS